MAMHSQAVKSSKSSRGGSPAGLTVPALLGVALIAFVATALILLLVVYAGEVPKPPLVVVLAGAALLAAILLPTVYALVLAPLKREYEARLKAGVKSVDDSPAVFQDPVTRLPNRRGITTGLLESMAQAERYGDPLSVALVEVESFDKIGSELGAKAAERSLQGMAEVFVETLRMPDKAGRYDGHEFLVVLPHTNLKDAVKITERIRANTEGRELAHAGKRVALGVSIGATQFRKGEDLEQLLSRATEAKHQTGGRKRAPARRPTK
ncbi:MAG TPA: GGDEF domain-containing protein [Acidiferrobacterales bacterium]